MREKDALKGWTTNEDLLTYRRGILPFRQILVRVKFYGTERLLTPVLTVGF